MQKVPDPKKKKKKLIKGNQNSENSFGVNSSQGTVSKKLKLYQNLWIKNKKIVKVDWIF